MRFSKITTLSILALASSVIAAPTPIENVEASVEVKQVTRPIKDNGNA